MVSTGVVKLLSFLTRQDKITKQCPVMLITGTTEYDEHPRVKFHGHLIVLEKFLKFKVY